jgi:hypothetical protein
MQGIMQFFVLNFHLEIFILSAEILKKKKKKKKIELPPVNGKK